MKSWQILSSAVVLFWLQGCIPAAVCGDLIHSPEEECEDGNTQSGDGCDGTLCTVEPGFSCSGDISVCVTTCGDSVAAGEEACDDGNTSNGDGCREDCSGLERCGDGILDPAVGEQCDDGNTNAGDGCDSTCFFEIPVTCGDGAVDAGEECDDANQNDSDDCRNNCHLSFCGDGITASDATIPEECDDANQNNNDSCDNSCRLVIPASCGDGVVNAGEECDDQNQIDTDSCRNNCHTAICGDGVTLDLDGDGVVDAGDEGCDDGNQNNSDFCKNDCTLPVCGDGLISIGEGCDDGNQNAGDGCRPNCTVEVCGDGIQDQGEACDDGNTQSGDNCRGDCKGSEVCGDNLVDVGEECDTGALNSNTTPNACRADCTNPGCGDNVVDTSLSEQCDDGNAINTDACTNICHTAICGDGVTLDNNGNGVVDAGDEACDDGNQSNTDACLNSCKVATCGDGFTQAGVEECDNAAANSNTTPDACRTTCKLPSCGDNVIDPSRNEQCDDGNAINTDTCLPIDCVPNLCTGGNLPNGDTCYFLRQEVNVTTGPRDLAIGDIDDDGDLDIVTANGGSANITILKNNGAATFASRSNHAVSANPDDIALADLDNDGDLDIITANSDGKISIIKNGLFFSAALNITVNDGVSLLGVVVADFNKDGKADIATTHNELIFFVPTRRLSILTSVNPNQLTYSQTDLSIDGTAQDIDVGDINNDGAPEIALTSFAVDITTDTIELYTNNGTGTFTHSSIPGADNQDETVAFIDLDNDGDDDLLGSEANFFENDHLQIFTSNGSTLSLSSQPLFPGGNDLDVADLDSDLDQDACSAYSSRQQVGVLLNQSASFIDQGRFDTLGDTSNIAEGDLDGDGFPEIVSSNPSQNSLSILLTTRP